MATTTRSSGSFGAFELDSATLKASMDGGANDAMHAPGRP